jgi:CRP/FNR family transcriptional regulator, cyclic AMP receptor protein
MSLSEGREDQCELQSNLLILRNIPYFQGLSPDFLRVLAYLCEKQVYATRDIILQEGEPAETAVVAVRGSATIEHGDTVIDRLEAGGCIGGFSLLGQYRWIYTLRAVTEMECLLMPRFKLLPQIQARPDALIAVVRGLIAATMDRERRILQARPGGLSVTGLV